MATTAIDQTKLKLKQIIESLDVNIGVDEIGDQESLFEEGIGLDSITLVNFIVQIESKFEINFNEDEMNLELFSTIDSLANLINAKLESRPLAGL